MRKQVKSFANEMEKVLKTKDKRGGWDDMSPCWLLMRLKQEVDELEYSLNINHNKLLTRQEAIDVANFAMMIWDVLRK